MAETDSKKSLIAELPEPLRKLAEQPRIQIRRGGMPAKDARCVVYWMQRSERGVDNPALDCAIDVANELGLPVVAFFSAISNFPRANLRHYAFLNQGLHDAEADMAERGVPLIVRRPRRTSWNLSWKMSAQASSSATRIHCAIRSAGGACSPVG